MPSPDALLPAFDRYALDAVLWCAAWLFGEDRFPLNQAARLLVRADLLKLGVPALLALWIWVRPSGYAADPVQALRQVGGVLLAMAVARGAQLALPERARPLHALPDYPFPDLGGALTIGGGGSMPSDHAALAFALAAVAWAGSRRLGTLAFCWAALGVCFPRLYFGYHHLSDIVAGAATGVLAVRFASAVPLPGRAERPLARGVRWLDRRAPGLATVALAALAFECVTLFWSSRTIAGAAAEAAAVVILAGNGTAAAMEAAPPAADAAVPCDDRRPAGSGRGE